MKLITPILLFTLLFSNSYAQQIAIESTEPYDRSVFGRWADLDGDCLNTRHEILMKKSIYYSLSSSGCSVESGLWVDFYTGSFLTDPSEIDIDHIVSLNEIWVSGGYTMDRNTLRMIANDETNLVVTAKSINAGKSNRELHEWQRFNTINNKCRVVMHIFTFKLKYGLSFDQEELEFLYENEC